MEVFPANSRSTPTQNNTTAIVSSPEVGTAVNQQVEKFMEIIESVWYNKPDSIEWNNWIDQIKSSDGYSPNRRFGASAVGGRFFTAGNPNDMYPSSAIFMLIQRENYMEISQLKETTGGGTMATIGRVENLTFDNLFGFQFK